MKRLLAVGVPILLIALLLIYLGDWAVLSLRKDGSSSVQVDQFLRTP